MISRRKFYRLTLVAVFLFVVPRGMPAQDAPSGLANPPPPLAPPSAEPPKPHTLSPVIWSENLDVVNRFNIDAPTVREMVDNALLKLTSATDLGAAWTRLGITPDDVVGIKITTMGGPLLSTHKAVVQAISDGLQKAGVPVEHIIIWDKDSGDMRSAGYTPAPATESQPAIASVIPGTGYDPVAVYHNGILGTLIWGDSEFINRGGNDDLFSAASRAVKGKAFGGNPVNGSDDSALEGIGSLQSSNDSHYANLVTRICTKIINVPAITDNPNVGIEGCLGSLALACTDNNRRFQGDPSFGDPALCEILAKDYLRRKVVVNILDALIPQYAGGPRAHPQFTRPVGAIYVSRDPVAIDSLILQRMENWRATDRSGRIDPIGKTASHIHSATNYKLGTDDAGRIQLIKMP